MYSGERYKFRSLLKFKCFYKFWSCTWISKKYYYCYIHVLGSNIPCMEIAPLNIENNEKCGTHTMYRNSIKSKMHEMSQETRIKVLFPIYVLVYLMTYAHNFVKKWYIMAVDVHIYKNRIGTDASIFLSRTKYSCAVWIKKKKLRFCLLCMSLVSILYIYDNR